MEQNHFYQKPSTWLGLSFLTGATVMVAAVALVGGGSGVQSPYGTSAEANALMSQSPAPVSVVISQPADGEVVTSRDPVGISVTASAIGGVQGIAIWVDDQLVKTCAGARCLVVIAAGALPALPTHTIQAMATGLDDQTGSALRRFSVVPAR